MAYPHDAFPFPMDHQIQGNMYFQQPMQYTTYLQQHQPHPTELMVQHHLYPDYGDFMPLGMMLDEYDDNAEVSTRPRLTKEQVEVLEAQFQAHPKPNSMVKKQLALQTKLTLPRVANWFQNRRAKAKQQRKQEEFEMAQSMGMNNGWKSEANPGFVEASSKASSPKRQTPTREERSASADPRSPIKTEFSTELSWASLQKALSNGKGDRQQQQRGSEKGQTMFAMPPPERPAQASMITQPQSSLQGSQSSKLSPSSDWSNSKSLNELTSPSVMSMPTPVQDLGFDFGFDQDISSTSRSNTGEESPNDASHQYLVSPQDWPSTFTDHASSTPQQSDFTSTAEMSPLTLPTYPTSRRGSGADELTANLGTFALTGTPPVAVLPLNPMGTQSRANEGEIDIASRRKRPRPAALTTTSLRSRSYGQLTSTSPAFRPGPPSGNALRHVKSTGHGLNSHYAGIRKSSLPQKSPMSLAFAETDSLQKLVAQQAAAAVASKTPLATPSRTEVGPSHNLSQEVVAKLGLLDDKGSVALTSPAIAQFQHLHSPPHTPFQPEYMMHAPGSMPPPSARSQYASFAEYTPPYSAGPLTNSTCWSDAPLHSPDVTGFSSGSFMSSLAFSQQQDPCGQQWILPVDPATELGLPQYGIPDENKRTAEFFITEFPGQKEEYASIAQHVLHGKPKNYVFANTAPSDYDG